MDYLAFHRDSLVVDTHNDLILLVDHFDRQGKRDHFAEFWLPQLRQGGVNVQILPIWLDEQYQSEGGLRRTLLLAERIHELAEEHADEVQICLTGEDVDHALANDRIALIIALEGAHGMGQDVELLRSFARIGVRVLSMAHFGRTFLADGSGLDNSSRGRLTPQGIETLSEMERLGVVFDISHLGVAGVEDVLGRASRPFLATHSACLTLTDVHRNLSDEHISGIAALGGVVCVAAAIPVFIDPDDPSVERVVDHIEHLVSVAGVEHVGLGPDFIEDYYLHTQGGWPVVPGLPSASKTAEVLRPSDLPKVTEAMLRRGFSHSEVQGILGTNVMRVLREVMGRPLN